MRPDIFPREIFRKAAELGLTGIALPENEGGAGFDHVAYSIVIEEISRVLRVDGRDFVGAEFALLRSDSSFWNDGAEGEVSVAVCARGKNRLLRADRAAGGFERGGVADEGGAQGRQLHRERHESVDHQWRRGGCGDRVREHRSGQRERKGLPRW